MPRLIRTWRLARYLERAAERGDLLLSVPRWLAPELQRIIWERKVERAGAKWAARVADVPLSEWRTQAQRQAAAPQDVIDHRDYRQ